MSAPTARGRPSGSRLVGAGAVLVALGLAPACHKPVQGPRDTVTAFAVAVEQKDWSGAYALMSTGYRRRVSASEFRARLETAGVEASEGARRLREGASRLVLRTEVDLGLGQSLPLVDDGGVWRVDGTPPDPFSQRSPREALRTFVRAARLERWDVLVRLVPVRFQNEVTAERIREFWVGEHAEHNRTMLAALEGAFTAPIVEDGDEAHMPYGDRAEVRFVRESGLWRIEEPE